jgi:single-stranded-DNA-specific exonuclease
MTNALNSLPQPTPQHGEVSADTGLTDTISAEDSQNTTAFPQENAPKRAALRSTIKRIRLKEQYLETALAIQTQHHLSPITSRILSARGLTAGPLLSDFIAPSLQRGLPSPEELKGLPQACQVILSSVDRKENIAITCDFDVDGLSSGSQLFDLFTRMKANVHLFVPDRFKEGYGLNRTIIDEAARLNCKLLITVDFGTSNQSELEYAASLGMRSIVIDHHHVSEHHQAVDIFINPNQKDCGFAGRILCAAGLTWYVIAALRSHFKNSFPYDPREYLDLAALGTICDMVPLTGVNRLIAKKGLEALGKTTRPGLLALMNVAGLKGPPKTHDVSFGIGPRLNAAGRMVHGGMVIELLTTSSTERAYQIAHKLNELNADRQREEKRVLLHATKSVETSVHLPAGFVVYDPSYHTGVVGIVAQRLVEKFHRPSAVIGIDDEGLLKGSIRSIPGISVIAVLDECREYLIKFGGHEGAGGFALAESSLVEFRKKFTSICQTLLNHENATPAIETDTQASLEELSLDLVHELAKIEPCGIGNKAPTLLVNRAIIKRVVCLKDAHLKFELSNGATSISAIMWKCTDHPYVFVNNLVNVALRIETNSFRGNTTLQAQVFAVEQCY